MFADDVINPEANLLEPETDEENQAEVEEVLESEEDDEDDDPSEEILSEPEEQE